MFPFYLSAWSLIIVFSEWCSLLTLSAQGRVWRVGEEWGVRNRKRRSRAQESRPLSITGKEVVCATTDKVSRVLSPKEAKARDSQGMRGLSLSSVASHRDHCTVELGAKVLLPVF